MQNISSLAHESESEYYYLLTKDDISPLLNAMENADLNEFSKLIDYFDLNSVYYHETFPEPQLLSHFLLKYFLGLVIPDDHFPTEFLNAEGFIKAVLAKNPDLTLDKSEYSFINFINARRIALIKEIANLRANPDKQTDYFPNAYLLNSNEAELALIKLIKGKILIRNALY